MSSEHSVEWQFGGWPNLAAWLGWTALALVALAAIVLAVWFYRHTLRSLTFRQRVIFTLLRGGFLLSIILCLAGPARVEKVYDSDKDARPLAVVVDRSQSMTVPDLRGKKRLSEALRVWKQVDADAVRSFPALSYFHFSTALTPDADLESAMTSPDAGSATHLYGSLDQLLKNNVGSGYGGIVCLTDGLDTTDASAGALVSDSLQNHTPLYFAVGQDQQAPQETLLVRELSVPGQVLRKSSFNASVLVEARAIHPRDVPLSLWMDNQPVAQTTLHLRIGLNLIPWQVPLTAGEPGLIHLECRLGSGAEEESIASAVPVVGQNKIAVLFYQGTLDWNFQFIERALENDSSFALAGLFNPNLNLTQAITAPGLPTLTEMPASSDTLQPFQIVVLSNVYGNELSATQQAALIDYVHGGGGLLFLVSDNTMAQSFSGTPLESVLPVVFEAPPAPDSQDQALEQFQNDMHNVGGSDASREDEFVAANEMAPGPVPLSDFASPPTLKRPEIAGLFTAGAGGTLRSMPQFAAYARVQSVKAGGEVLAVHPQDKTDANEPRALLVTQRYGEGQVTTLLTDALWRWRLSLPSTSHDPEVFWQQLFRALARHVSGVEALRMVIQPFFAASGQSCVFQLNQAKESKAPTVTAIPPNGGTSQVLAVQPGPVDGSWSFQFTPNQPGKWRVRAEDEGGAELETLLRVSSASHAVELSGLPADVDGLRKLAEATGGSLLNDGVPETWSQSNAPRLTTLVSKRSRPLWNNWAVLLVGLGFYVTELVWRRSAKLL